MKILIESVCKQNILHNYNQIENNDLYLKEVCQFCNDLQIYGKWLGNIADQKRYIAHHFRDILQPSGETKELFEQIYGTKYKEEILEVEKRTTTHKNKLADIKDDLIKIKKTI